MEQTSRNKQKMGKIKYTFGFLVLIVSNAFSNQSSSVDTYLELKKYHDYDYAEKIISTSFNGMLEGMIYTDIAIGIANGEENTNTKKIKHFFCIPPNYSLNGKQLQAYVDDYMNKNSVNGKTPLISVALFALKEKFPCE